MAGWLHTKISVHRLKLNPDTVAHLSTIFVITSCLSRVWLLVPVQLIAWKHLSLKYPVICRVGLKLYLVAHCVECIVN